MIDKDKDKIKNSLSRDKIINTDFTIYCIKELYPYYKYCKDNYYPDLKIIIIPNKAL